METCFLTSVVCSVTLGGSTEHFTANDGFKSLCSCKIQCVSDSAVREFRNPCSNRDNAGLMMWTKADT